MAELVKGKDEDVIKTRHEEGYDLYKCNACGEAENTELRCYLYTIAQPTSCPVTGEDCDEWIRVNE